MGFLVPGIGLSLFRQVTGGTTVFASLGPVPAGNILEYIEVTISYGSTVAAVLWGWSAAYGPSERAAIAALQSGSSVLQSSSLVTANVGEVVLEARGDGIWKHRFPIGVVSESGGLWVVMRHVNVDGDVPQGVVMSLRTQRRSADKVP